MISITGELDLTGAPTLAAALSGETRSGARICIDLSRCGFIDSSGLQAIVAAARELRRLGGELSVTGLHGDVVELFRISGLLLTGSAIVHRESL